MLDPRTAPPRVNTVNAIPGTSNGGPPPPEVEVRAGVPTSVI
ncbi:MAG: hypothetical protein ACR2G2_19070 [Pseudonocardia sp.]